MNFTNAEPKGVPNISICMATYRKQFILDQVLESIKEKNKLCGIPYEIIVCDDCPNGSSLDVARKYGANYIWNANCSYSNPSIPRNKSFKLARGNFIIHQSDDVIHKTTNSIRLLYNSLLVNRMVFATVHNVDPDTGEYIETYTGLDRQKPYFFLGAIRKKEIEKVGGYDEDYITPAYDDDDLADRLIKNGNNPVFLPHVLGHHINHPKGEMSDGVDSSVFYYSNYFNKKKNESSI